MQTKDMQKQFRQAPANASWPAEAGRAGKPTLIASSLLSTSFFAIRMPGFALVVLLECCLLEQRSQQLLFATLFILLLGRRFRLQTPNDI